jgi:hypothetical protein
MAATGLIAVEDVLLALRIEKAGLVFAVCPITP